MLNSNLTRAVFGALILSAPALAIIPPEVTIRIGGADLIEPFHYVVHESQLVTVAVSADPGDLIWAFASPISEGGEVDYSITLTLLFGKAPNGKLSGIFKVPPGLAGQSFSVEALALSAKGDVGKSSTVRVDVTSYQARLVKPLPAMDEK